MIFDQVPGAIICGATRPLGYYIYPACAPGYSYRYGDCYVQRRRFWDGYGCVIRLVRVCE